MAYSKPPHARRAAQFSLSLPSSAASSRNSSPAPLNRISHDAKPDNTSDESPGRLPVDVYDAMLPRWRADIRQRLLRTVELESKVIARMQDFIRTPFLDAYFVYTSSLGTHTFFMTAIPGLYFFGYDDLGGGLVLILAFGVYLSSFLKDLVCSPRPFCPPVTRLTIGTHHLEYGFPSTHSTNSVSIALFLFALIHRLTYPSQLISSIEPSLSEQTFTFLTILLGIYTFSIVYGRLYTAMHSFTDCAMGVFLGALIWWAETSWTGIPVHLVSSSSYFHPTSILINALSLLGIGTPLLSTSPSGGLTLHLGHGLGLGSALYAWVEKSGWEVPLTLIPVALLAVNQHPQPVDDCPCFEDAIAFGSVVLGVLVGKWATHQLGISRVSVIMPGSGWVTTSDGGWIQVPRSWEDVLLWWGVAIAKMTFGIFTIFAWRLLAKSALHLVLPPIYRFLALAFELPKRRFYTPATKYKNVPSEFSKEGGLLRPIPSVIDLPGQHGVDVDGLVEKCNGNAFKGRRSRDIKKRLVGVVDKEKREADVAVTFNEVEVSDKDGEPIMHYDADVATKLVVYSGIAVLASEALPALYNVIGWGTSSWPPT